MTVQRQRLMLGQTHARTPTTASASRTHASRTCSRLEGHSRDRAREPARAATPRTARDAASPSSASADGRRGTPASSTSIACCATPASSARCTHADTAPDRARDTKPRRVRQDLSQLDRRTPQQRQAAVEKRRIGHAEIGEHGQDLTQPLPDRPRPTRPRRSAHAARPGSSSPSSAKISSLDENAR